MSLQESNGRSRAIGAGSGNGIEACPEAGSSPAIAIPDPGPNPECGSEDDWFLLCAWAVFGTVDTGNQLYLATSWPRTSCYAFVAKDPKQRRKPNSEFLRVLFRSRHGKPFQRAFMDGCTAEWWIEEQRSADLGRRVAALIESR